MTGLHAQGNPYPAVAAPRPAPDGLETATAPRADGTPPPNNAQPIDARARTAFARGVAADVFFALLIGVPCGFVATTWDLFPDIAAVAYGLVVAICVLILARAVRRADASGGR